MNGIVFQATVLDFTPAFLMFIVLTLWVILEIDDRTGIIQKELLLNSPPIHNMKKKQRITRNDNTASK